MLRQAALAAVFLAIGASVSPAQAEEQPAEPVLRLTLDAPAACPTEQELVSAVLGLVARPERTLAASIVITEWEGRFYADLRLLGGERHVDAATCRALSDALVVILALTIDPKASTNVAAFEAGAAAAEAGRAQDVAASEPVGASPQAKRTALEPERSEAGATAAVATPAGAGAQGPLKLGASALLLLETGILPKFAFGATGFFRIQRDRWAAELGAGALLPRSETLATAANSGGTLAWASGLANACFVASRYIAVCLGVEVGRVFGKGFGVDVEHPAGSTWVAGAASAVGRIELGSDLSFEGRVALAVPTSQPIFGIDGQELYRIAPVSGRLLAGIAFQ
jgi:hypothetical protein